jgi:hypothetical protein
VKQTIKLYLPAILYCVLGLSGLAIIMAAWEYQVFKREVDYLAQIKEDYLQHTLLLKKAIGTYQELIDEAKDSEDFFQKKKSWNHLNS